MLVTVDFEMNGVDYRIERGRKPNIFKFLVNGDGGDGDITDEMQGEGRESQRVIERVLGMSHTMFKHIVALNTYTEPFLGMRANDQRDMIEQLLGITKLSEKAEILKELTKISKDKITEETYRIRGTEEANERIGKSIADLERRQTVWEGKRDKDLEDLERDLLNLQHIDINVELKAHADYEEFTNKKQQIDTLTAEIARLTSTKDREQKRLNKAQNDLNNTLEHKCYACGQEIHDEKHEELVKQKTEAVTESQEHIDDYNTKINEYNSALDELGPLDKAPTMHYNSIKEAYEHQGKLSTAESDILRIKEEVNPYNEQITALKDTGLQEVDWSEVNRLTELKEHQDFLLKLLTNKDSFVRKKIIEQNLQFLNTRLEYYITRLGLPHEVQFQSDLTVTITQLGQDLDFDNLSRGERNRLILGLSWSFRDVFESMNHPINLICIDELVDSGMDTIGVESALGVLKKMERERHKNILLISHRDELVGRVDNVLQVTKENGFTTFNVELEVIDA